MKTIESKLLWSKRILFLVFGIVFLIGMVSAVNVLEKDKDTIKQGDVYIAEQFCANSTYSNISNIKLGSTNLLGETSMSLLSSSYYQYNFTNTSTIGVYTITFHCNENGVDTGSKTNFEVTPSGFTNTFAFYLLMCLIIVGIISLGYKAQEEWFIVIGGMALMMLGIYSINSGVAGFKDMFMTWGIGIIEIGIGFVLTIIAGLSKADIDITSESW